MTKTQLNMTALNQLSIKSLYMLSVVAESKSMQQAADKLCISPSALSHQMQRLEKRLGRKLFFKEGRLQKLLPDAKQWANELNKDFTRIEQSASQFLNTTAQVINLGVSSAFAFNRVTPALSFWLQEQTGIDVRIRMLNCEDDPQQLNLDAVLGSPLDNDFFESEQIVSEKYVAVCSGALFQQLTQQQRVQFYDEVPLLELSNVDAWQVWSNHCDQPMTPHSLVYFSHTILMLQAVLSGQGVALLDYYLVKPQIEKGLLVQLSHKPMELDGLVHSISIRRSKARDKAMLELKEWLKSLF